jgi:7-cyano-7-deazaguanine synthase
VPHVIAAVDPILFGGSALTTGGPLPDVAATEPDSTYVPARNTVLIALAAARAESIGAQRIVVGCNADDAGGYPDCRPRYLTAFRDVLHEGTLGHVWVHAPLLYLTKQDVIDKAHQLNVPVGLTWSCYAGGDQPCGQCGACVLRGAA